MALSKGSAAVMGSWLSAGAPARLLGILRTVGICTEGKGKRISEAYASLA